MKRYFEEHKIKAPNGRLLDTYSSLCECGSRESGNGMSKSFLKTLKQPGKTGKSSKKLNVAERL